MVVVMVVVMGIVVVGADWDGRIMKQTRRTQMTGERKGEEGGLLLWHC